MHLLKRLELNGFKSFAGKTALDFPEGITAIVGPNGSGKSNIVDAIRWLLGEREAKNLRGGKGEDLIFAGTPKRTRAGMASASLHFENHKKLFPVEFAEIAVAREVARDGTNHYFLNKSEVLLRDLIELFTKVRLGSRGLVVITQGNSDVFVRANPKERREMVEEILGLKEYELRRAEAERRLKSSEINIEKARALIEEILPHLRSLKRQTSRWEKRSEFENELHELENQFFGSRLGKVNAEMALANTALGEHEKSKRALVRALEDAEEEVARVETNEPKERSELRELKQVIAEAIEKRSHLEKELGRLEGKIETTNHLPTSGSVPATKILESLQRVRNILKGANGEDLGSMREAVRKAISEIETLSLSTNVKNPDYEKIKLALDTMTKDLKGLHDELAKLKEQEIRLEKSQENFHRAFREAIAAREAAKSAWEKWERDNREFAFKKERLEFQQHEIERQVSQAGRDPHEFAHAERKESGEGELRTFEGRMLKLRGDLAAIGEVDEAVMKDAKETEERHTHLAHELEDLEKARKDLRELIRNLEEKISEEFKGAMGNINEEFQKFFTTMFGGGHAKLVVEKKEKKIAKEEEETSDTGQATRKKEEESVKDEEEAREEEGIVISVNLPRKKISSLEMLSGGERSLVGIAALFALVSVSPPPFLVLDEIDAALDERNARRFAEILKDFSKKTQFVIVTHNRATMEVADVLYGITLGEDGTSKILSLKLESAESLAAKDKEIALDKE